MSNRSDFPNAKISDIGLKLDGEFMEDGSIEYKTLCDLLEGTAGSVEGLARAANMPAHVSLRVRPPKEGSFAIVAQIVQSAAPMVGMLPEIDSMVSLGSIFVEYLKIKMALKGEPLRANNIQLDSQGKVEIKNRNGTVVYHDHRKIINVNLIANASESLKLNKSLDKLASAIEKSAVVDSLSLDVAESEATVSVAKEEATYLKFEESFSHKSDQITGYIREIDNQTAHGTINIVENGETKSVNFSLDLSDISRLDAVISILAVAEGRKERITLIGKKIIDDKGNLKKMIAEDVQQTNTSMPF